MRDADHRSDGDPRDRPSFEDIIKRDQNLADLDEEARYLLYLEEELNRTTEVLFSAIKNYALHHRMQQAQSLETALDNSCEALASFLSGLLNPIKNDLGECMDLAIEILVNIDDSRVEYIDSGFGKDIVSYLDVDALKRSGQYAITSGTVTDIAGILNTIDTSYRNFVIRDVQKIERTEWPED